MIPSLRKQEIIKAASSAIRGSAITMRTFGHGYTDEELQYGCEVASDFNSRIRKVVEDGKWKLVCVEVGSNPSTLSCGLGN